MSPFFIRKLPDYKQPPETTVYQLNRESYSAFHENSFKHCLALDTNTIFFGGHGNIMGLIKIRPATSSNPPLFDASAWIPSDWVTSPIIVNPLSIAYPTRRKSVCVCEFDAELRRVEYHNLEGKNNLNHPPAKHQLDSLKSYGRLAFRKNDGMLIHLYYHSSHYQLDFYDANNRYSHVDNKNLSWVSPLQDLEEFAVLKNGNLVMHDKNKIYIANQNGEKLLQEIDTHTQFTTLHIVDNIIDSNKVALLTKDGVEIWCLTAQQCMQRICIPQHTDTDQRELKVLATGGFILLDKSPKENKVLMFNAE